MKNMYYRFTPLFDASSGATGGTDPAPAPQGTEGNTTGATEPPAEPMTLQSLIESNPNLQSDLDRRIQQAVATATTKERERQQIVQNQLEDEVIRVSKMTPEEKEAYLKDKADRQTREREAALLRRELTLDARSMLQDKGLPESFLDILDYTDKDKCTKSIETIESVFTAAVQKGIDAKLTGVTPPKDAGTEGAPADPSKTEYDKMLAEAYAAAGVQKQ